MTAGFLLCTDHVLDIDLFPDKAGKCAALPVLLHIVLSIFLLLLLKTSVPGTGFWQRFGEPGFSSANVRHGSIATTQNSCHDCFSKTKIV